jgi:inosine-uridine nucleoside N-ribohydrolase
MIQVDRIVPEVPPKGKQLRLIIDTDFANEIDDLYAVSFAMVYPERFKLEGIIAANFNNRMKGAGPESVNTSYRLITQFLASGGLEGRYTIKKGSNPMPYYGYPSESEGVDYIIERAKAGSAEDPLWVVGLGASTDLASALLKEPGICDKVRFVFHARNDANWPVRTRQFNVKGDIHAARTLLKTWVPLVWFDTGTHLACPMALTEKYLASTGGLGKFIHEFRFKQDDWQLNTKGFFDMGDFVYLYEPDACNAEVIKAPTMDEHMFFDHEFTNGKMVRVYDIDNNRAWNLLFEGFKNNYTVIGGK